MCHAPRVTVLVPCGPVVEAVPRVIALRMPTVTVVRTYLELRSLEQLRDDGAAAPGITLHETHPCPLSLSRALYQGVGAQYHWTDRDEISDEEMTAYLARDTVRVVVARSAGRDDGFFELVRHDDGSVEIAMFGLFPHAHGRGLGKWLLVQAARTAFAWGATRTWLHTCTLDAPAALPNYRARGFTPCGTETYETEVA